jgi:TrkA family protein/RyR domain-containing protein
MESHSMSKSERPSGWQWWLGAILAILAFTFGAWGLWLYESSLEHGAHPDLLSVFYHTLQLFILHAPHLEPPLTWQLHLGRWLAAGLVFWAAGRALFKVFRNELLLLRLWSPWQSGHVVVCGLGDLGLRLALDGRRLGRFIVAVEKQPASATLEKARASGVLVLEGDAQDLAQLRRARVGRADFLIAACEKDQTNVAIASLAGQFAQGDKRVAPLVCRLMIQEPRLRAALSSETYFPNTGNAYRVNFNDLDLEDTAARQALRAYPLDFEPIREKDETVAHLVVIGFGQMGQSLAVHAARIGHFANEVGRHAKRFRITVVDKDPSDGWTDFLSRYDKLQEVCDAEFTPQVPGNARFLEAMDAICPASNSGEALVTYAVCIAHNDDANLRVGLELAKMTAERPAQVLIHQTSRLGFAALFPDEGRGSRLNSRVHVFGMGEDVFAWDVLLHESEDKLARAFHEDYRAQRAAEGIPDEDNPHWEELTEGLKDSNRQAADHLAAKLRALGFHEEPVTRDKHRIERFDADDQLLLAKMEHARWRAERWLAGWKPGPARDPLNKISDCLIPWDQLPLDKQKRDREQIAAIPEALYRIHRGIYR